MQLSLRKQAQGIQCVACHNPVASNLNEVAFPGFETDKDGNPVPYVVTGLAMISLSGLPSGTRIQGSVLMHKSCNFQGGQILDAVVAPIKDDQGKDVTFGFRNIHYFAAAATLYGTEVKAATSMMASSMMPSSPCGRLRDTCTGCHDPHTLQVKVDECAACHGMALRLMMISRTVRMPQLRLGL